MNPHNMLTNRAKNADTSTMQHLFMYINRPILAFKKFREMKLTFARTFSNDAGLIREKQIKNTS